MTDTLPRRRGNRYAISALKRTRASIASEIRRAQPGLGVWQLKEALGYVDATLRLLDPTIDPEAIPCKRYAKRQELFSRGQIGRQILGVLRGAERPLTTTEIVSGILAGKEVEQKVRRTVRLCARECLRRFRKRGVVVRDQEGRNALWGLA